MSLLEVIRVHAGLSAEDWESIIRHRARVVVDRTEAPRVLVVEDDEATRRAIAEFLSDEGFAVIATRDGVDALELATHRHPDVIVLDLGLPTLDGAGFAAHWRIRSSDAGVPIVVVSGRPEGPDVARAVNAAAFYPKPLNLVHLARTIRSFAYGRRPKEVLR